MVGGMSATARSAVIPEPQNDVSPRGITPPVGVAYLRLISAKEIAEPQDKLAARHVRRAARLYDADRFAEAIAMTKRLLPLIAHSN
jgi:hypothetical protein